MVTASTPRVYPLTRYPLAVTLRDGTRVALKPLVPEDEAALLRFFLGLSEADRFYLKEDVTAPEVVHARCQALDYHRVLPLLAWVDGEIVADASLHRRRAGARRHTAEVRLAVAPAYRNRGLGSVLLKELLDRAYAAELERVVMELVADAQQDAIAAAQRPGFLEVARLAGQARDSQQHPRDLVILEAPLGKWYEWWQF